MHTDTRELEEGSLIEGDLCIVGAGAAGISMAMEWIGRNKKVILLEGGGFNPEMQLQDLYRGESIGVPYQVPLESARLHFFGGTTGHWAGWCAPMDDIDMKKREWVPNSGWPFEKTVLDPFYERAHPYLELGPYNYDVSHYEAATPERKPLPLDEKRWRTKMWQFSPPTRFGTTYREAIVASDAVHLYTYANVTEITANEAGSAIEGLIAKTIDGKAHSVKAKHYVLACGSIQNARLMLASNKQMSVGIGNQNDLVGRYFMEHFEMGGAQMMLTEPDSLPMYAGRFGGARLPTGELALTEEIQKAHRILNCTASIRPGTYSEEILGFFQVFSDQGGAMGRLQRQRESGNRPPSPPRDPNSEVPSAFRLQARSEQAPNPLSRVKIGTEKDALGMPRVVLDWQTTEMDKRTMQVFFELLGQEMGRLNLGRIQLLEWLRNGEPGWPSFLSGGFHHMGTTRMHDDPKQGVLDANGKVHGIANLHVAGASMFPTSGAPNPTLTLVALSLRLSDHLNKEMG